jgi:transcriptional regulator with XRE-family HTH domain
MLNESFGKVLQRLRKEKGFSQESFGFEADLHRTYVSQLERGLKSPSLNILSKICKALGISMSQFILIVEREEEKAGGQ